MRILKRVEHTYQMRFAQDNLIYLFALNETRGHHNANTMSASYIVSVVYNLGKSIFAVYFTIRDEWVPVVFAKIIATFRYAHVGDARRANEKHGCSLIRTYISLNLFSLRKSLRFTVIRLFIVRKDRRPPPSRYNAWKRIRRRDRIPLDIKKIKSSIIRLTAGQVNKPFIWCFEGSLVWSVSSFHPPSPLLTLSLSFISLKHAWTDPIKYFELHHAVMIGWSKNPYK